MEGTTRSRRSDLRSVRETAEAMGLGGQGLARDKETTAPTLAEQVEKETYFLRDEIARKDVQIAKLNAELLELYREVTATRDRY